MQWVPILPEQRTRNPRAWHPNSCYVIIKEIVIKSGHPLSAPPNKHPYGHVGYTFWSCFSLFERKFSGDWTQETTLNLVCQRRRERAGERVHSYLAELRLCRGVGDRFDLQHCRVPGASQGGSKPHTLSLEQPQSRLKTVLLSWALCTVPDLMTDRACSWWYLRKLRSKSSLVFESQ